jgi:hypothetical protein
MKPLACVMVLVCAGSASAAPPTKPAKQASWADEPAWPEDAGRLELQWVIGPDRPNPRDPYGGGLPLRPVELIVTIGRVSRHLTLEPETGSLRSYNQVMCKTGAYPLGKAEVGKLTFDEGGASGYAVKRTAPDVLEIHSWAQTDGACESPTGELVACPVADELKRKLHVPAGVKITGGTVFTTEHGKLQKLACDSE